MTDDPSPTRLESLRLIALAKAQTLRQGGRRRGGDGGTTPALVAPTPPPLPLNGGAEAVVD